MRHPTDGTLRRLLDEPAGVADADRSHVAGCAVCRAGLAAAQRDATLVRAVLDAAPSTDVDAAWQRLGVAMAGTDRPRAAAPARRWRALLRSPAVAAVGVAVVLVGAGAAAAGDWLQIFRTEQIAPVTAPESDLVQIPELSDVGDLTIVDPVSIRQVADAAAAERATGLTVPRVGPLPRGVTGAPAYHVGAKATAVFTYSAAKTERFAGRPLPAPPAGLDGSQYRLQGGPRLGLVWSSGLDVPAMAVVRAVAPTAYTASGVPFETARDYLLSLDVLPPNVAAQLRAFSGDGRTLPLFMSVEHMTSTPADVNGTPATVLTSRDEVLSAVVWLDGTVVTAVAGSLSADEVLTVARGLVTR
jgi:hypothetical protein